MLLNKGCVDRGGGVMVKCPDCNTEMQLREKVRYGDAYWKCPKCKIEIDDEENKT